MLIFERTSDDIESEDFLCYKEAVQSKNWTRDCMFGPNTQLYLGQQHYDVYVKSLNDSNNADRHVIIDNTPFPYRNGARPRAPITLLLQTRTEFNNKVIVKQILILEGMVCLLLLFGIGVFTYMCLKMKSGH